MSLAGRFEVVAGSVVTCGGSGVSVASRDLHVAEWDAGIESGGDEAVAQRVGRYVLGHPGCFGQPSHDPGGGVPSTGPERYRSESAPCRYGVRRLWRSSAQSRSSVVAT